MRRFWLLGTVVLTAASVAVAIGLAPSGSTPPVRALPWLLFLGSSVHVAATCWFYSVREVRGYARARPWRFLIVPAGLVLGSAGLAVVIPPARFSWLLLPFFGWQFFHFQKQNLGLAALAGVSLGVGSVRPAERGALTMAGIAGTAGLLAHPELLQLSVDADLRFAFPVAFAGFVAAVGWGLLALRRRPAVDRPGGFVAVYLVSLLFFLPVFAFGSPYRAVAGLTLAHGYQYLLIVGLVAAADRPGRSRVLSVAVLVNVALLGGALLSLASHLHGVPGPGRALYGAFLGAVMAHFVVDAGLWRLRDDFPRRFLTESVPYLMRPAADAGRRVAAG